MSLRAPLLLLTLAAFVFSRPAQAGRASACKAPPFAVPKETQRAVDAAIDARVTGTGAGAVSSSVETRTDYETTTLSQDAAARAWTEYTLCLKLAKKLISQDLHDELLRELLSPALSSSAPTQTTDTSTSPPVMGDLAGTWQVTSTYRRGSCPFEKVQATRAYQWLVSVTPSGEVTIDVQGQTNFERLQGHLGEGRLIVGAVENQDGAPQPTPLLVAEDGKHVAILSRSDFDLQRDGDAWIGTRDVAWWSTRATADGTGWLIEPCVLHYEVRATR